MLRCCAAVTPPQCQSRRRRDGYGAPPAERRAWIRCSATTSAGGAGRANGSLAEEGASYKERFMVRCYEVGSSRAATIQTVANLLQETGCNHVKSVGFSVDGFATTMTMRKLGLIWVTSRLYIEMYQYPAWGDVIEIETWCREEGKIGTRRDWILTDRANSLVIGRATSKFVMMNQDTRKLERVSEEVREECLAFRAGSQRSAFWEDDSSSKRIPRLRYPAQHLRLGLEARRADLDMNQHVNHVTYIGWAMESIPQEIIDTYQLRKITLDYKQECHYNDVVDSLTSMELGSSKEELTVTGKQKGQSRCQFLHSLRLSDTGVEINRGCTEWKKRNQ